MEIFENRAMGSRPVPDEVDACSRSGCSPRHFPKADGRFPLYEKAIARLDSDGHLYPCYCTRAEIRASASAPHGIPAADRYPGTCRELTAIERAERERPDDRPPLGYGRSACAWLSRTVCL